MEPWSQCLEDNDDKVMQLMKVAVALQHAHNHEEAFCGKHKILSSFVFCHAQSCIAVSQDFSPEDVAHFLHRVLEKYSNLLLMKASGSFGPPSCAGADLCQILKSSCGWSEQKLQDVYIWHSWNSVSFLMARG
eukprot:439318-Karenia_brevis.AAC.1